MSERLIKAQGLVWDWLLGENGLQFGSAFEVSKANPNERLHLLMSRIIRSHWEGFGDLRQREELNTDRGVGLRATQHLLKAASAARAAVVWNSMRYHTPWLRANDDSFVVLRKHFQAVLHGKATLPEPELLDAAFEDAIAPESVIPIEEHYRPPISLMNIMAGHAINLLLEQAEEKGAMTVPRPGLPTGTILSARIIWTPSP